MITRYHYKKLTWIDIEEPTADDITAIIKEFSIHPAWARELLTPSERAKTDTHEKVFYAVLHYPDHPSHLRESRDLEIDYIISEHFIITAHYTPVDIFIEMQKQLKVDDELDKSQLHNGVELFLELNNRLYHGLREELEPIRKEIKRVESEIFLGNEFHMVKELSHLQRRLLDFKQALRSHKIILHSLDNQSKILIPKITLNPDLLYREYSRVENALENNYEIIRELRTTNDSLLSSKNNDVTKRFTMMAFFTFPLALVSAVLLAPDSPEIFHGPHGFWIVVGILLAMFIGMYTYFAYKKWL